MAYQLNLGTVFVDVFQIYESDEYTKRSGVTTFVTTVYKNGVVSSVPATIAEIGTSGDYRISFTPDSIGLWKVIVYVAYDHSWWGSEVCVSYNSFADAQVNVAFDDSVPRMYMEVWLDRGGQPMLRANLVSCSVSAYDMAGTLLFTEASTSPKVDNHFSLYHDLGLTADRPYNLVVTVVDTIGTVVSSHGISTVS
jgi:hypothetical protein